MRSNYNAFGYLYKQGCLPPLGYVGRKRKKRKRRKWRKEQKRQKVKGNELRVPFEDFSSPPSLKTY